MNIDTTFTIEELTEELDKAKKLYQDKSIEPTTYSVLLVGMMVLIMATAEESKNASPEMFTLLATVTSEIDVIKNEML